MLKLKLRAISVAWAPVILGSLALAGTFAPSDFSNSRSAANTALPRTVNGWSGGSNAALNGGTGRGVTWGHCSGDLGVVSDRIGVRSGATASRAVSGPPSDHRSRMVRISAVCRYSSFTTVRSGIQADTAIAGTRTPERLNVKPIWPAGAAGSGGGAGGGGT